MKKLISSLFLLFVFSFLFSSPVYAAGGNMDGGGGGMGEGNEESSWSPGKDGVRVTVVALNGDRASPSIDFSNNHYGADVYHFGKKSKLDYRSSGLSLINGGYTWISAPNMPRIINTFGSSDIAVIKSYFCMSDTINYISAKVGIPYDELISGAYKILIEPIAYLKYKGILFAMTATEAALYDQITCGDLWYDMQSLTHQNLPLAIFLERADLGIPSNHVYTGIQSRNDIVTKLGVGTVSFDGSDDVEIPPADIPEQFSPTHYEYHNDIDVYTAAAIRNDSSANVDAGIATLTITGEGGFSHTVETEVKIPKDRDGYIWWKWRTPVSPQNLTMNVTISNGVHAKNPTITANITSINLTVPPDPAGTDRNDTWGYTPYATGANNLHSEWGQWSYENRLISEGGTVPTYFYFENYSFYFTGWSAEKRFNKITDSDILPRASSTLEFTRQVWNAGKYVFGEWSGITATETYPGEPSDILKYTTTHAGGGYRWTSWIPKNNPYPPPPTTAIKRVRNLIRYRQGSQWRWRWEEQNFVVRPPTATYHVQERTKTWTNGYYTHYYKTRSKVWNGSGAWINASETVPPLTTAIPIWAWVDYDSRITASSSVLPSDKVPTPEASGGRVYIKSGYGVQTTTLTNIEGGGGHVTAAQNVYTLFPEFNYNTYGRWQEPTLNANTFGFLENEYSRFFGRTHFTPIWYPDMAEYPIVTYIDDVWTPGGKLVTWKKSSLWIDGNVYDDWHIRPVL